MLLVIIATTQARVLFIPNSTSCTDIFLSSQSSYNGFIRITSSHQHSTDISGGGGCGGGNRSCCNAVHSNIHALPEQRYANINDQGN